MLLRGLGNNGNIGTFLGSSKELCHEYITHYFYLIAMAFPIPLEAPVIKSVLPSSKPIF
jgi:hypothetical protein